MQNILLAVLIGFLVSLALAPLIIKFFLKLKTGQPILHYVESHFVKSGTPTMGGFIFLAGTLAAFLLLINQNATLSTLSVAIMFAYAFLGFLDDFIKVRFKRNEGLKAYQKALGQVGIAVIMAFFIYNSPLIGGGVIVPFLKAEFSIGWLILPFVVLFYLAVTNSVNLIDGLDGLSSSVTFVYLLGFMAALFIRISHMSSGGAGIEIISEYENILTLCGALAGALLAFLCFNSHPAKIFMGDTGSLALGGFVATAAALTKMYLFVPLLGLMYVLTAVSDIIQVGYYKATKKRVFLMAPLHHHFEKKGWHETKIVTIYIIITTIVSVATILLELL